MKPDKFLAPKEEYYKAVKALFPKGAYWDKQLGDETSDVCLWIHNAAEQLHRYRERFQELITESNPKTAVKTIEDWEQVLLGSTAPQLPLELRRSLLLSKRRGFVNRKVLQDIGLLYGATIKRIELPYRSAFFGHSKFGIDRICSPVSFSLIFIHAEIEDTAQKAAFESEIEKVLLAHNIVKFFYK